MRGGLLTAWLVGEAIIVYRTVHFYKRPPMPGELLQTSGLFVLLALLSDFQPGLATLLAWGFNLAAILRVPLGGTSKTTA